MPCPDKDRAAGTPQKGFGSSRRQALAYTGPGPGEYSPQLLGTKYAYHDTGSAAFCTTGRSFSASGASSSSRSSSSSAPGPGQHGVPVVAHTGADLNWTSPTKPGAAAAFKAPPRCTASATQLREQLNQQKYQHGKSVPWLLAPPKHTGGRPLPGPCGPRLVQSAHAGSSSTSSTRRVDAIGAQQHKQPSLASIYCASDKPNSSSSMGRATWKMQDGSTSQVGPGSYDLLRYTALQDKPLKSAFRRPLVQDRFGVSTLRRPEQQPQTQPPGVSGRQASQQRHTQLHGGTLFGRHGLSYSSQPGVSAGFCSGSPGHTEALLAAADAAMVGAPGPGYYSPQPPPHKVSYRQACSAHQFVAAV